MSAFEQQRVLSPDGEPYSDMDGLAEGIVVYFHEVVPEVFGYSRAALEALDANFAEYPPSREFRRNFLDGDLLPSLGAYVGKVIAKRLGGRWELREPLLKSIIVVDGREINPFRAAYEAVHHGGSLASIYDTTAVAIS